MSWWPGRRASLSRWAIRAWLAPAPSQVIISRRRYFGGKAAIASSSTVMWSAAVFEPALPGRSIPANGSLVLSHQQPKGCRPSLNNQHRVEGSGVVAGHGDCPNTRGQPGLVPTSGNEEKLGEPFGTECPLSVARRLRSLPTRPAEHDIPVRLVACGR